MNTILNAARTTPSTIHQKDQGQTVVGDGEDSVDAHTDATLSSKNLWNDSALMSSLAGGHPWPSSVLMDCQSRNNNY